MNLDIGDRVIYYPGSQRSGKTQDELFLERSTLGTVSDVDYAKRTYTVKGDGILNLPESIPENYVRAVRVKHWYQFWRNNGFYLNLWAYFFVVLFFFIFIYRG